MSHGARAVLLITLVAAVGAAGGEALCRVPAFGSALGRVFGRGNVVAITHGVGVYQADVDANAGRDVTSLVIAENLRRSAAREALPADEIDREMDLLQFQFADRAAFDAALHHARIGDGRLRADVADELKARRWIEQQIQPALQVTPEQCRVFYDAHRDEFTPPTRFHVRHLFLAAHAATPPDIFAAKEKAIAVLATRLAKGDDFAQLAAEASEDEATKNVGGDLGWFSTARVPEAFLAAVQALRPGETSAPFRSRLGFHIAQLAEVQPARRMAFEEVQAEIANRLANEQRAAAVASLAERLGGADYVRTTE